MFKPRLVTRRRVFTALVVGLALALGGAGLAIPALAAPAGDASYNVVAALDKPSAKICVGDVVTSPVQVVMSQDGQALGPIQTRMWIDGSVANPNIGKFVAARKFIGWNSDRPSVAVFAFHADHAGKTTLTYQAEIHYYKSVLLKWLNGPVEYANSNPVSITVVNCKYQVTTISLWKEPGEAYTAVMKAADLTADANDNFTGQGTVTWEAFWAVVPPGLGAGITCVSTLTAPPSPVDLKGQFNQAGNLVVTIHYHDVQAPSWHVVCSGKGGSTPPIDRAIQLSPTNLEVLLPSSGVGSFKPTQTLNGEMSGGFATVIVIPAGLN